MSDTEDGKPNNVLLEDDEIQEDEAQDWRKFSSFVSGSSKSSQGILPKRGEKDYAPDGTIVQKEVLEESLDAMYNALSAPRGHVMKANVKAVWMAQVHKALVLNAKGGFMNTMGQVDAKGKCWLNLYEFTYLVERGTIEPVLDVQGNYYTLSLQQVYSFFSSQEELDKYFVYAHLKRHGFIVREDAEEQQYPSINRAKRPSMDIFWFTFDAIFQKFAAYTEKYTNESQIYRSLRLVKYATAPKTLEDLALTQEETHRDMIAFNVWKPCPSFKKSKPGIPDFQIVIYNKPRNPHFYTLHQMREIFSALNYKFDLSIPDMQMKRIKKGHREVIIAVLDSGFISFVKLTEAEFGREEVWFVKKPYLGGKRPPKKNNKKKDKKKTKS